MRCNINGRFSLLANELLAFTQIYFWIRIIFIADKNEIDKGKHYDKRIYIFEKMTDCYRRFMCGYVRLLTLCLVRCACVSVYVSTNSY